MNTIYDVNKSEISRLSDITLRSMANDPLYKFLFPNLKDHYKYLMKFWTSLIHYTHYHGKLNTNKDCNACACWLPPNKTEMTVLTLLQTFFKIPLSIIQFPAEKKWHAIDIFNYLGEHQKKCITKPHWYLMQLAVAPEYQGKGIGSALIQPVLQHADNNNLECYLETETELNVKFYRKNGFFVENEFLIPKYNLHFYAMIRKPNN